MNFDYEIKLNSDNEWYMHKHHFHENYEILLSLSDAGSLFAESHLYPLNRGTLLILKNTTLHKTIANKCDLYERYVIHFPKETLSSISTKQTNLLYFLSKNNQCIHLDENELQIMIQALQKCTKPKSKDFGCDLLSDIAFIELLLLTSSFIETKESIDASDTPNFSKMAPVLEYIQSNLSEDLSLTSISERFFISKYHLSRTFKAATGFNVVDYIINCRVLKAREFLREGHSVQASGELSGFKNNAHFIRTFGKLSGISPGRYMKNYKEGQKQ